MKNFLKVISVIFCFIGCFQSKKTTSNLKMNQTNFEQISSDSIESLFINARNNPVKSQFLTEKILMANGQYALIATSDNRKTKTIVSQYPNLSPVQFLLGLSNIEGEISMYRNSNAKLWVDKGQVDSLFSVSGSLIITPTINALTNDFSFPPDTIFNLQNKKPKGDYLKMPLGHNALCLIYSHVTGYYPSANYESVEKLKTMIENLK